MRMFRIASCDITQAFFTAYEVRPQGKIRRSTPIYSSLRLVWRWGILDHFPAVIRWPSHALMGHRPLYGSRCAPIRWYLTTEWALRRIQVRCRRSDVFVCARDMRSLVPLLHFRSSAATMFYFAHHIPTWAIMGMALRRNSEHRL